MNFSASLRAIAVGVLALGSLGLGGLGGSGGCGKSGPEPSKVAAKAEAPAPRAKAEQKEEKKKKPPVPRISRPDEYFHFTLGGPMFESRQKFTFDADSVRINVVNTRSAIQYVRKDNEPASSADGSQVVVSQIQWAGGAPGEFVSDDKRSLVLTLGVENRLHETATLHLKAGKLTLEAASLSPRELKGSFEGTLERKNKGKEGEVYEIMGAFNLAE